MPIFFSTFRNVKSKDGDKPVLYRGQVTLSVDQARTRTRYKYVVVKKGTVYWEDLMQFASSYFHGIVNRVLKIPEKYTKPGGKLGMTISF